MSLLLRETILFININYEINTNIIKYSNRLEFKYNKILFIHICIIIAYSVCKTKMRIMKNYDIMYCFNNFLKEKRDCALITVVGNEFHRSGPTYWKLCFIIDK